MAVSYIFSLRLLLNSFLLTFLQNTTALNNIPKHITAYIQNKLLPILPNSIIADPHKARIGFIIPLIILLISFLIPSCNTLTYSKAYNT